MVTALLEATKTSSINVNPAQVPNARTAIKMVVTNASMVGCRTLMAIVD